MGGKRDIVKHIFFQNCGIEIILDWRTPNVHILYTDPSLVKSKEVIFKENTKKNRKKVQFFKI